jgi:hypothetical protein
MLWFPICFGSLQPLLPGSGPSSFYSVFSVGDFLIVQKEPLRVSVYSLRDDQKKATLSGILPAASAQSNLLAIQDVSNHVDIYDLNTFARLDRQLFSDELAYIHFFPDGKRLFVLTEHQEAFLLDVSRIREGRPAPSHNP